MCPSSIREDTADSRVCMVEKGQTRALFLLIGIVLAASSLGFSDIKVWKTI